MEAECHEVRGIRDADYAKDAAFLFQLVIVKGMGMEGGHRQIS
jgi:hypothetical protein